MMFSMMIMISIMLMFIMMLMFQYLTNKGYKFKSFLKKKEEVLFACLRRSRLSRTPLLELMIGICRGSKGKVRLRQGQTSQLVSYVISSRLTENNANRVAARVIS